MAKQIEGVAERIIAAVKIIVLLLAGETAMAAYTPWLIAALAGFLLRTALYNGALSMARGLSFQYQLCRMVFIMCRTASFWSAVRLTQSPKSSFNSGVNSIISPSAKN